MSKIINLYTPFIKCGDIVLDLTRKYAAIVHFAEYNGRSRHFAISNTVRFDLGRLVEVSPRADWSDILLADDDERCLYFDCVRQAERPPHYEGTGRIKAGSLIVCDDRYIALLTNDVKEEELLDDEVCKANFSWLNCHDMLTGNPYHIQEGPKIRLATDKESERYWQRWKDAVDSAVKQFAAASKFTIH